MPRINPDRLLEDLHTLRGFGAQGNGVVRPSLSGVDMQARRWLADRFEQAGLESRLDGVGNVFGRWPGCRRALLAGSHSDTQPTGGWLDGALGVIYALEVARALAERPHDAACGLDVVAWVDEEGTFLGCLGSRAFVGQFERDDPAYADICDASGRPLADALAAAGLAGVAPARYEPERHVGYLEAHIEQGPYLEMEGNLIGVVTAIVGIRGYQVEFLGQQNHAGTTPMHLRRDAGIALIEFGHAINEQFSTMRGERTVWTMGHAELEPGAPSIIPGRARLSLQMRDPDDQRLQAMEDAANAVAERMTRDGPVQVVFERNRDPVRPTVMDERLAHHIAEAAERRAAGKWRRMPSAAGHDPMVLEQKMPCAMLFIPSIDGVSHDFAEDSHESDIVLGCQVLADAVASICAEHG